MARVQEDSLGGELILHLNHYNLRHYAFLIKDFIEDLVKKQEKLEIIKNCEDYHGK